MSTLSRSLSAIVVVDLAAARVVEPGVGAVGQPAQRDPRLTATVSREGVEVVSVAAEADRALDARIPVAVQRDPVGPAAAVARITDVAPVNHVVAPPAGPAATSRHRRDHRRLAR